MDSTFIISIIPAIVLVVAPALLIAAISGLNNMLDVVMLIMLFGSIASAFNIIPIGFFPVIVVCLAILLFRIITSKGEVGNE